METERTRNTLLSAVSHDLRTPLASITGSAGALLDEQAPLAPGDRRELLETIRDEATRLARLVGDLLDLTRIESGSLQVNKEWVPLEEVVGSALGRYARVLEGRDVKVDIPKSVLLVQVDAVLIEQVFINLLDNAAKFSPPATPIEIHAEEQPGEVSIEIADHGPGLPPSEQDRIFEKFYRTADGKRVPGSGLGLTVCQAIVKAHGGSIRASNRSDGSGAIFSFVLPIGTPPVEMVKQLEIEANGAESPKQEERA
jgi:two-component system sensor histidine kinase KdpD